MDGIHIIWINLERSLKRKEYFENQLKIYNISSHTRVPAIDGSSTNFLNNINGLRIINTCTNSELACSLSHIKAIRKAKLLNLDYVLIMEDNCNFEYLKYQYFSLKDIIKLIDNKFPEWEALQLSVCNRSDKDILQSKDKCYIRSKYKNGTTCYLLNKKAIQKKIILKNIVIQKSELTIFNQIFKTFHITKPYFTYNFTNLFGSTIYSKKNQSNIIRYKKKDTSKKFWDNFYINECGISYYLKKQKYKIVILIFSKNDDLDLIYYETWKKYMNVNDDVLCLFVKNSYKINYRYKLDLMNNILYIKDIESNNENINYRKIIRSFEFCHKFISFKYILKTKINTFWNFDNLLIYLKQRQHGKYILIDNDSTDRSFIIPNNFIPSIFENKLTIDLSEDEQILKFYEEKNIEFFPFNRKLSTFSRNLKYDSIQSASQILEKYISWNIVYYNLKKEPKKEYDFILERLLKQNYYKIFDKIFNKKVKDLVLKNKVNIFLSPKCKKWGEYFCDEILNLFDSYKIIKNPEYLSNCDIIFTHIKQRIEYFNENAVNIILNAENYTTKKNYDLSISTIKNNNSKINLYLPYLYQSLKEHARSINYRDYLKKKNKFCAYLYSVDHSHRIQYFNLLSKYKKVDGLGKSCNNCVINLDRNKDNNDETWLDEAVQIYSDYKFVIAMENKNEYGYITEKIINPLIAGSIPIYWGCSSVFNYINKKRVIYVNDFNNDNELLEHIKKIDQSDELYNEIINQKIYIEHCEPKSIFDNFRSKLKKILS